MRIMIYSESSHPLAEHLRRTLDGHQIVHRNSKYYRGEIEPCDVVLVSGFRKEGRAISKGYSEIVPVLVIDWGYFARVNVPSERHKGHWQVSPYRLNNPPQFACPDDRFAATGLKIKAKGGKADGYALVCGQMPMDGAVLDHDHAAWLRKQVSVWADPVYREHPRGGVKLQGVKTNSGSLDSAFSGARVVVTHNSNIGHEALLAGLPVMCSEIAPYASLSGEKAASVAERKEYFSRAAYGQWLWSELPDGIMYTLENLHRWNT